MKTWKKSLTAVAVGATLAIGGMVGIEIFRDAQFAQAAQEIEDTRSQLADIEGLSKVFREVGKVVEPSVVQIQVRKKIEQPQSSIDEDQLRRFFPNLPRGFGGGSGGGVEIGTGSGVIVEVDGDTGYIVTNNHVAGDAEEMTITLADGRRIEDGKLVGADPKTDLAVVSIKAKHLLAAKWGDSAKLDRGDWVMAFGSPFGYVGSMTHGIISALNRNNVGILGANGYEDFIQVDAPINPGNSGGPLVNVRAQVIGINTAIATRSGGFQGIGFAIPSNQAKQVFEQLKAKGRVSRGWLGVSISNVDDPRNQGLAESFGYTEKTGVLVQSVLPETPAVGKLKAGDIITKLDGKAVDNVQQLRNVIAATPADTEITFTIFRDKTEHEVVVKLAEQPDDMMAAARGGGGGGSSGSASANIDELGLRLQTMTKELADRLNYTDAPTTGAVVISVKPDSLAERAGLRPGDIITQVDDTAIETAGDARQAIGKADLATGTRLYVTNGQGAHFIFIRSK